MPHSLIFSLDYSIVFSTLLPTPMIMTTAAPSKENIVVKNSYKTSYLMSLFAGCLLPLGFAPFHLPGFGLMALAILFGLLQHKPMKPSLLIGLFFGIGFSGFGVSWVFISILNYGHQTILSAFIITCFFILYVSLFPALMAWVYAYLAPKNHRFYGCLLFSVLWTGSEYLRATLMGGFPWLLMGYGQMDTPIRFTLPILGVYGASFIACLSATCLTMSFRDHHKRFIWAIAFVGLILAPMLLRDIHWVQLEKKPVSVGVVQANLSMRDKWDESLFWRLLELYEISIKKLMDKVSLIVLPESAIPLPSPYVSDFLDTLNHLSTEKNKTILLGIPHMTAVQDVYQNAMLALGKGQGVYLKQHLVPFGETIPAPFSRILDWLVIPLPNLTPGATHQPLIEVLQHHIASLICYEIAFPSLLRQQLPTADFIVSISDVGWFGHSFAIYQHLQMAQSLSLQSGRYQIMANNDGLSSIINTNGEIEASLPAFEQGMLESAVFSAKGQTPWVYWGDLPIIIFCFFIIFVFTIVKRLRHTRVC